MDELVCVINGDWVCREGGLWEFIMPVGKCAKIISISEVLGFSDLVKLIKEAFKIPEYVPFRLCFWYPEIINICTKSMMPPVEISNDVEFFKFKKEFSLLKCLNLFLSFDEEDYVSPCEESLQSNVHDSKLLSFEEVHVDDDVIAFVERAEAAYLKNGAEKMDDFLAMEEAEKRDRDCQKDRSSGCSTETEPNQLLDELVNLVDEEGEAVGIVDCVGDICTGRIEISDITGHPRLSYLDSQQTQGGLSLGVGDLEMLNTLSGSPVVEDYNKRKVNSSNEEIPVCDENDPFFVDPPPQLHDLIDDENETFYLGRQFDDKEDLKKCLALYALERHFCYKVGHSDKSRLIARCVDRKCPWRIYARSVDETEILEIRTLVLKHECCVDSRSRYGEMATPKVLAELLQPKFANGKKGPRACEIPDIVLTEMNVSISYRQAWYAKELALSNARGSEEESYKLLSKYLTLLVESNPGSMTDMMTVVNKEGKNLFKYLFVSFGAAIAGFPYVRKVVAIDGTHLTGKYKGTLVAASCQDGNMQIFPLAFGIVDSENEMSWVWFLENLKKIVHDQVDLVFVSDRHHSINAALKQVYPLAHHGACIIHICRNVNARYKSEGLANLVSRAARAYTFESFDRLWTDIQKRNPGCASWLLGIGFKHWTRVHSPRNRFNLMTSNICESFNAAIKKAADFPIITIVEYVRTMSMKWWSTRREDAANCSTSCTTQIEGLLLRYLSLASECAVIPASKWIFQVNDPKGKTFTVDLEKKHCTCNVFDVMKIPCPHAIAAAQPNGVDVYTLVDPCYSRENWSTVYQQVIMPVPKSPSVDKNEIELDDVVNPPETRRPSGRPKKGRYRSVGEIDSSRRRAPRCGRCSGLGHYRATCTNVI